MTLNSFALDCLEQVERMKSQVTQVSKPAVSPTSKSAMRQSSGTLAGLETRDTADLEVCATDSLAELTLLNS
jgi:hypothetical protein